MKWCTHLTLFWCWNIMNTNLEPEILGRLNWQYHELLHSTESCPCLVLPNILLSSVSNSIFYAFVTASFSATMSSFHQCRNTWLRYEQNELHNFNYLPITSRILASKFLTTVVVNTLKLCPSLITKDQDSSINKQQVKIHALITMSAYMRQKEERHFSH